MSSKHNERKCRHKCKHRCYDHDKLSVKHLKACDAKVKNMNVGGDLVVDGCITSGCANIDTKCTLGAVTTLFQSGPATPADPNAAVGEEVVVSVVNQAIIINDKRTGERLYFAGEPDFWDFVPSARPDDTESDPVITYDEFSKRFIYILAQYVGFFANSRLTVDTPEGIAGDYPADKGTTPVNDNFDISGKDIVPADPLNADTPIQNSADMLGKIALISSDGFATSSNNKVNNCGRVNDLVLIDPLTSGPLGISTVTVTQTNHGYLTGQTIRIEGAIGFNGISASDINKTHIVTMVDTDHYTIDVSPSASSGAGIGGGSNITVFFGAVGAIIFNSDINELLFILGGDFIPTISVSKDIGEAMLANLPVTGGIKSLDPHEVGENSYTNMLVAVSKNANPKGKDDFYQYIFGGENGIYDQILADYPRVGVDEDAIYISTNSFELPVRVDLTQNLFQQVVAIEKAPLVDGTGPVNILLNNLLLVDPVSSPNFSNVTATIKVPSVLRPPKTNVPQVTFFVNPKLDNPTSNDLPASGSALTVSYVKDILGTPVLDTIDVPVNPWTSPSIWDAGGNPNTVSPQPISTLPYAYGYPIGLCSLGPLIDYRVIYYKDSLWCTMTVQPVDGPEIWEVRWYELDVSEIFNANNPTITLKQEGAIIPGGTTNAFYSSVDVDRDGNMGIGFNICGPDQPIAMAHTGRLSSDPIGTVRFPFQVNFTGPSDIPYYDPSYTYSYYSYQSSNRWNDYTSTVLDPSDGKTFWFCSQYNNPTLNQYYYGTMEWYVGLVNWCVDDSKGKTKTYSGQEPKEEKPICKTLRTVPQEVKVEAKEELKKLDKAERKQQIQNRKQKIQENLNKLSKEKCCTVKCGPNKSRL